MFFLKENFFLVFFIKNLFSSSFLYTKLFSKFLLNLIGKVLFQGPWGAISPLELLFHSAECYFTPWTAISLRGVLFLPRTCHSFLEPAIAVIFISSLITLKNQFRGSPVCDQEMNQKIHSRKSTQKQALNARNQ